MIPPSIVSNIYQNSQKIYFCKRLCNNNLKQGFLKEKNKCQNRCKMGLQKVILQILCTRVYK